MKIAFLIPILGVGGAERVTISISQGLRPAVETIEIITNEIVGEFVEDARNAAKLYSLETYSTPKMVMKLRKSFQERKPDIVFAQGTRMSFAASLACILPGHRPKVIWCLHNPYSTKYSLYPKPVAWLLTRFASILALQPTKIIGVSDGVCRSFLHYFGDRFQPKTMTLHNPIPSYKGVPHQERTKFGQKKIIAIGRLERQKNFKLLIETMPLILRKIDARIDIYGIGPLEKDLNLQIAQLGLEEKIALKGYSDDVREHMAESDVFVLSSSWEGLPTVLIEAMSTGVPVVATDCVSGPDEILEGGKWGNLVPEDDPSALAEAIISVLQDGGVDPRPRARDFEPQVVVARYINLIHSISKDDPHDIQT